MPFISGAALLIKKSTLPYCSMTNARNVRALWDLQCRRQMPAVLFIDDAAVARLLGEGFRNDFADALRTAGDDHDAVFKFHGMAPFFSFYLL